MRHYAGRRIVPPKIKEPKPRKPTVRYIHSRHRRLGISEAHYYEMLEAQEWGCAICGEINVRLCLDHCHRRDRARAILCDFCNQGLGRFRDRPDLLQKAISYLAAFD